MLRHFPHAGKRKDESEDHVEGNRKDQVTSWWPKKKQKVIEIKNT